MAQRWKHVCKGMSRLRQGEAGPAVEAGLEGRIFICSGIAFDLVPAFLHAMRKSVGHPRHTATQQEQEHMLSAWASLVACEPPGG